MTCGSSEPLATVGNRCCPFATVATRTQRGPGPRRLPPCERQSGRWDDCANVQKQLMACAVG
jgi:hypothetical protein